MGEDQRITDDLEKELSEVGGDLEEETATRGEESDYDDDKPDTPSGKDAADKESKKDDESEDSEEDDEEEESDDEEKDSEDSDEKDSKDDDESDEEDDEEEEDEDDDSAKDGLIPQSKLDSIRQKSREKIRAMRAAHADEISKIRSASTPAETEQAAALVKGLSDKYKMDPQAVTDMMDVFSKAAEAKIRKNLGIGDGGFLGEAQKMVEAQRESAHFDNEWSSIAPTIEKDFPQGTKQQVAEARTLMDKLSHSKEYAYTKDHPAYPLDYVLFKNRAAFDKIFRTPKRATLERGAVGSRESEESGRDIDTENIDYERMSAREKRQLERDLLGAEASSTVQVKRGGKTITIED